VPEEISSRSQRERRSADPDVGGLRDAVVVGRHRASASANGALVIDDVAEAVAVVVRQEVQPARSDVVSIQCSLPPMVATRWLRAHGAARLQHLAVVQRPERASSTLIRLAQHDGQQLAVPTVSINGSSKSPTAGGALVVRLAGGHVADLRRIQ